jgi:caffeoyl-CoA O-methyltransferase
MTEQLLDPKLLDYFRVLRPERNQTMIEMENLALEVGFNIVGPDVGHLMYLFAKLVGAKRIFELGSGFGYSTAWFARAVHENGGGEVHHVVWDEVLSRTAKGFLEDLDYDCLIQFRVGEAVGILQTTDGPFDLIFNDIDKDGYPASIAVIKEKLRPGGLLILDNMLWQGRIFDPKDQNPQTLGIRQVTHMLNTDRDFTTTLLPIGDGILLAYYQPDNSKITN